MVFLVTKAALAATIVGVGVTFGALSYLARRGQENSSSNNGLLNSNTNFDSSGSNGGPSLSQFPDSSKDPPPLESTPLPPLFNFGPGGFRLFGGESSPFSSSTFFRDCDCKVIHECSTFRGGSSISFRLARTCGFQGFQRKICCDESPSYFSTPPPYLALDEVKSAHAHLLNTNVVNCQHNHDANGGISGCNCDHYQDFDDSNKDGDDGGGSSKAEGSFRSEVESTTRGDVGSGGSVTTSAVDSNQDQGDNVTPAASQEEEGGPRTTKPRLNFPDINEYFKDDGKLEEEFPTQVPIESVLFPNGHDSDGFSSKGRNDRIDAAFGEDGDKSTDKSTLQGDMGAYFNFPSLNEFFQEEDAASDLSKHTGTTSTTTMSPMTEPSSTPEQSLSVEEQTTPKVVAESSTEAPTPTEGGMEEEGKDDAIPGNTSGSAIDGGNEEDSNPVPSTTMAASMGQDKKMDAMTMAPEHDDDTIGIMDDHETTTAKTAITSQTPSQEFPDVTESIVHGSQSNTQRPQSLEFEHSLVNENPEEAITKQPEVLPAEEPAITTVHPIPSDTTTATSSSPASDISSTATTVPSERRPFALSDSEALNDFNERVTTINSILLESGENEQSGITTTTTETSIDDDDKAIQEGEQNENADHVPTTEAPREVVDGDTVQTVTSTVSSITTDTVSAMNSGNNDMIETTTIADMTEIKDSSQPDVTTTTTEANPAATEETEIPEADADKIPTTTDSSPISLVSTEDIKATSGISSDLPADATTEKTATTLTPDVAQTTSSTSESPASVDPSPTTLLPDLHDDMITTTNGHSDDPTTTLGTISSSTQEPEIPTTSHATAPNDEEIPEEVDNRNDDQSLKDEATTVTSSLSSSSLPDEMDHDEPTTITSSLLNDPDQGPSTANPLLDQSFTTTIQSLLDDIISLISTMTTTKSPEADLLEGMQKTTSTSSNEPEITTVAPANEEIQNTEVPTASSSTESTSEHSADQVQDDEPETPSTTSASSQKDQDESTTLKNDSLGTATSQSPIDSDMEVVPTTSESLSHKFMETTTEGGTAIHDELGTDNKSEAQDDEPDIPSTTSASSQKDQEELTTLKNGMAETTTTQSPAISNNVNLPTASEPLSKESVESTTQGGTAMADENDNENNDNKSPDNDNNSKVTESTLDIIETSTLPAYSNNQDLTKSNEFSSTIAPSAEILQTTESITTENVNREENDATTASEETPPTTTTSSLQNDVDDSAEVLPEKDAAQNEVPTGRKVATPSMGSLERNSVADELEKSTAAMSNEGSTTTEATQNESETLEPESSTMTSTSSPLENEVTAGTLKIIEVSATTPMAKMTTTTTTMGSTGDDSMETTTLQSIDGLSRVSGDDESTMESTTVMLDSKDMTTTAASNHENPDSTTISIGEISRDEMPISTTSTPDKLSVTEGDDNDGAMSDEGMLSTTSEKFADRISDITEASTSKDVQMEETTGHEIIGKAMMGEDITNAESPSDLTTTSETPTTPNSRVEDDDKDATAENVDSDGVDMISTVSPNVLQIRQEDQTPMSLLKGEEESTTGPTQPVSQHDESITTTTISTPTTTASLEGTSSESSMDAVISTTEGAGIPETTIQSKTYVLPEEVVTTSEAVAATTEGQDETDAKMTTTDKIPEDPMLMDDEIMEKTTSGTHSFSATNSEGTTEAAVSDQDITTLPPHTTPKAVPSSTEASLSDEELMRTASTLPSLSDVTTIASLNDEGIPLDSQATTTSASNGPEMTTIASTNMDSQDTEAPSTTPSEVNIKKTADKIQDDEPEEKSTTPVSQKHQDDITTLKNDLLETTTAQSPIVSDRVNAPTTTSSVEENDRDTTAEDVDGDSGDMISTVSPNVMQIGQEEQTPMSLLKGDDESTTGPTVSQRDIITTTSLPATSADPEEKSSDSSMSIDIVTSTTEGSIVPDTTIQSRTSLLPDEVITTSEAAAATTEGQDETEAKMVTTEKLLEEASATTSGSLPKEFMETTTEGGRTAVNGDLDSDDKSKVTESIFDTPETSTLPFSRSHDLTTSYDLSNLEVTTATSSTEANLEHSAADDSVQGDEPEMPSTASVPTQKDQDESTTVKNDLVETTTQSLIIPDTEAVPTTVEPLSKESVETTTKGGAAMMDENDNENNDNKSQDNGNNSKVTESDIIETSTLPPYSNNQDLTKSNEFSSTIPPSEILETTESITTENVNRDENDATTASTSSQKDQDESTTVKNNLVETTTQSLLVPDREDVPTTSEPLSKESEVTESTVDIETTSLSPSSVVHDLTTSKEVLSTIASSTTSETTESITTENINREENDATTASEDTPTTTTSSLQNDVKDSAEDLPEKDSSQNELPTGRKVSTPSKGSLEINSVSDSDDEEALKSASTDESTFDMIESSTLATSSDGHDLTESMDLSSTISTTARPDETLETTTEAENKLDYDDISEHAEVAEPTFDLGDASTFSPPDTHDLTKSIESSSGIPTTTVSSSDSETVPSTDKITTSSPSPSIGDATMASVEGMQTTTTMESTNKLKEITTTESTISMDDMMQDGEQSTTASHEMNEQRISTSEPEEGFVGTSTLPSAVDDNMGDLDQTTSPADVNLKTSTVSSDDATTAVSPDGLEMTTQGLERDNTGSTAMVGSDEIATSTAGIGGIEMTTTKDGTMMGMTTTANSLHDNPMEMTTIENSPQDDMTVTEQVIEKSESTMVPPESLLKEIATESGSNEATTVRNEENASDMQSEDRNDIGDTGGVSTTENNSDGHSGLMTTESVMDESADVSTSTQNGLEATTISAVEMTTATSPSDTHASYAATTEYPDSPGMTTSASPSSDTHASYAGTTEYPDSASMMTTTKTTTVDDNLPTFMDDMEEMASTPGPTAVPMTIDEMMMGEDGLPITEITKSVRREPDTDKTVVELRHMSSQERNKIGKTVTAVKSASEATVSEVTTESALSTTATGSPELTTTGTPIPFEMEQEDTSTMSMDSVEIDTTMGSVTGESLLFNEETNNDTDMFQGRTAGRGVPLPVSHEVELVRMAESTTARLEESTPEIRDPIVPATQAVNINETFGMDDDTKTSTAIVDFETTDDSVTTMDRSEDIESSTMQSESRESEDDGDKMIDATGTSTGVPVEELLAQNDTMDDGTATDKMWPFEKNLHEEVMVMENSAMSPEVTTEKFMQSTVQSATTETPSVIVFDDDMELNETLDDAFLSASTPASVDMITTENIVADVVTTEEIDYNSTTIEAVSEMDDGILDDEMSTTSIPINAGSSLGQQDMAEMSSTSTSISVVENITDMLMTQINNISDVTTESEPLEMYETGITSMPEISTQNYSNTLNLEVTTSPPLMTSTFIPEMNEEAIMMTTDAVSTSPRTVTVVPITESTTVHNDILEVITEVSPASTEPAIRNSETLETTTTDLFMIINADATESGGVDVDGFNHTSNMSSIITTDLPEDEEKMPTTEATIVDAETTESLASLEETYNALFGSPSGRSARVNSLGSDNNNRPSIVDTNSPTFKTTTTPEPPFSVEVKIGPHDERSLFSSDITPVEKQLEGEISNVVSQLLLTTHKNFHLLPNFVECAGARGRTGRRKTRVLHFDTENYPWMARIGFREPRGLLFPCAGTIISRRYILTSAHCALRKANGSAEIMEILLEGAKNAAAGMSDQSEYKYKVEQVMPHPNYDKLTRENDLALIRLASEIPEFNGTSEVKPICLPFEDGYGVWDSLPAEGETAYLGGWGYGLKNMAAKVEEMDEAAVTIWSNENCTYLYRGDREKVITPKQICAYGKAEKDACRGDSGGPLMALMTRQKIFFQIGVVSYGPRCGYGVPGVYTRISNYLSWILDTMQP